MLFSLLDGYAERRRRELHEAGSIAATAHHDPKSLRLLEKPLERGGATTPSADPIGDYRKRRGV